MSRLVASGVFLTAVLVGDPAKSQDFSKTVFFGDSNTDSGWFIRQQPRAGTIPFGFSWPLPADAQGTPSGRPVWSEQIAAYLGHSATPANAPGGTNYAAAGARQNMSFSDTPSLRSQITNYLNSNGGRADPNAVHFVWEGVNDVRAILAGNTSGPTSAQLTSIRSIAAAQAEDIARLQTAGARYIVLVPAAFASAFGASSAASRTAFNTELIADLRARGVNYIPADFYSLGAEIASKPGRFGITNTTDQACGDPFPSGIYCRPSHLASPDAQQTYRWVDDIGHQTSVVNKIYADYVYAMLAAPGQISMLAETAIQSRAGSGLVGILQDQMGLSMRARPSNGLNAWVIGDYTWLDLDNYAGRPDLDGHGRTLTAGVDVRVLPNVIMGGAISVGNAKYNFGQRPDGVSTGGFEQHEVTGSLYAAGRLQQITADIVATYGSLDYNVNREANMGRRSAQLSGETEGRNWSIAASLGYDFKLGSLTHGPVAGVTWQRATVDGFAETIGDSTMSYLALDFGSQTRQSTVTSLGWRLHYDAGMFQPFARIAWKHELEDSERLVTAVVQNGVFTGIGYSLPATKPVKDWGSATLGTEIKLGTNLSGVISGTGNFSEHDASKYSAQIGLRFAY